MNTTNDEVFAKETEESGEKCLHPKKRKWKSSEDPQDPFRDEKASKTVVKLLANNVTTVFDAFSSYFIQ